MIDFKCEQCRAIFTTRLNECPHCGGRIVQEQFCKPHGLNA